MEDVLRILIFAGIPIAMAAFVIGGFMVNIAGRWRDGDRIIDLNQSGPWVNGHCPRPGGGENYRGIILFGRISLRRTEYGAEHLKNIGFNEEQAQYIKDQATARLRFRLEGDVLRGTFEGRRFRFDQKPVRIKSVTPVEPTERLWIREP